jgi:hypothetical protein
MRRLVADGDRAIHRAATHHSSSAITGVLGGAVSPFGVTKPVILFYINHPALRQS